MVEAKSLVAVELKEVDGFAYVGVGLGPVLADLEDEPRAELQLALADDCRSAEEQGSAFGNGSAAPRRKGRESRLNGLVCVFSLGVLVNADNLRRARRIDRANLFCGLQALAAEDHLVLAPEFLLDLCKRVLHGTLVLRQ